MSSFKLVTTVTAANPHLHDLELDASGQIPWIGGDIEDTADYAAMVAQRFKCRALQLRGEWYLDQRTGTPWEQRIWRKGANAETLRQVLRAVAEGTPGIRQLVSMEIDYNAASREATVSDFQLITETNQMVTASQLDTPMIIKLPGGPPNG